MRNGSGQQGAEQGENERQWKNISKQEQKQQNFWRGHTKILP